MFVKRTQLPIAPAFAITAHASQGKTEIAVIADLQVGRGVSSKSSYIAITRVRSRKGLLIWGPFDREPYTQGVSEGTALLLKKLSGETIDWEKIENEMIPQKKCGICEKMRYKEILV